MKYYKHSLHYHSIFLPPKPAHPKGEPSLKNRKKICLYNISYALNEASLLVILLNENHSRAGNYVKGYCTWLCLLNCSWSVCWDFFLLFIMITSYWLESYESLVKVHWLSPPLYMPQCSVLSDHQYTFIMLKF